MLMLPSGVKVFLSTEPADMRKSFFGLSVLVQDVLDEDPLSGHLFVFANKRGDKIKVLYWDRNGFALWYKQLDQGVFRIPRAQHVSHFSVTVSELSLILEGIDLNVKGRFEASNVDLIT